MVFQKSTGSPLKLFGKINATWLNISANKSAKLVGICKHKLPTNLRNFTQKDLTEVKIFQKVLGGYFFETPCKLEVILVPHSLPTSPMTYVYDSNRGHWVPSPSDNKHWGWVNQNGCKLKLQVQTVKNTLPCVSWHSFWQTCTLAARPITEHRMFCSFNIYTHIYTGTCTLLLYANRSTSQQ